MVRFYSGPIRTLGEAHAAGRVLWAFCRNCGTARQMVPWTLITKSRMGAGSDRTLEEVARRLKCRSCRLKEGMLIPATGLFNAPGHWR